MPLHDRLSALRLSALTRREETVILVAAAESSSLFLHHCSGIRRRWQCNATDFQPICKFPPIFCELFDILSLSYRFYLLTGEARPRLFKNLMFGDPSREFFRDSREFPFEFFVGQSSRRGLKFESTSANCWLPDFVYDDACLRLDLWFLN